MDAYELPGSRPGPAIQALDFKTGTIFANLTDSAVDVGPTETPPPQIAVWTLSLIAAMRTVPAAGKLARVEIGTTGFYGGTWELKLSDVLPYAELGGPYTTNFAGVAATIVNGQLHIPLPLGDYNQNQQFDVSDLEILASAIRNHSTDLLRDNLNFFSAA